MPAAESSLRITEAYRTRLFGLRSQLERRAETLWPTIEGLDDFTWTNKAAAATQNAQREAVALTGAYLTAFLTSEVGTRTRGPILDTRRYSGLSRDGRPLRDALRSPMIGVRFKLKEGATPEEALAYGLHRAKRMVSVDYDHAHRTALLDGLAADERFQGWQRAVTGTCGACAGDIAVEVSTNLPSIPLQVHPNCQCVTEPVVAPRSPKDALATRAFNPTLKREPGLNFTPEDWDELTDSYHYFGTPRSYAINNYLRTGDDFNAFDMSASEMQGIIRGMDTALDHAGPVGTPLRVHRGIGGTVEDMGITGNPVGKTFTDKGFGSTTTEEFMSRTFSRRGGDVGTEFVLTVNPQVKAIWGANPGEAELLLERGCRYVIKSVKQEGKSWRVEADVLPPL
jgi:hypothetical protein